MLTLKQIREERELTVARLAKKGVDAAPVVEKIIALDDRRKAIQQRLDDCLAEQNRIAKEIGGLFREGKAAEAEVLKERVAGLKEQSKELENDQTAVVTEMEALIVTLPNRPAEIVPEGRTAEDNLVVKTGGPAAEQLKGEGILPHWELAKKYDIIDFELGNKLTGAGFPVYKGKGARLQRALINFFWMSIRLRVSRRSSRLFW